MKGLPSEYRFISPSSLEEVLDFLEREPGAWRPFAGGTDLMVLFESGNLSHKRFLNINGFKELKGIRERENFIEIGALTSYAEIASSKLLKAEFSMLVDAAMETGGPAIQNRGTLGGNIANCSPAADSPPALLAYDAMLELRSATNTREIAYSAFHTGYKQTSMFDNELITKIRLPRRSPGWNDYYRKVGTRKAQAISKVCFAASLLQTQGRIADCRIALGSVAPTVIRCFRTEDLIKGSRTMDTEAAVRLLEKEIAPIDDIRSTAKYRRRVVGNLLRDLLTSAV